VAAVWGVQGGHGKQRRHMSSIVLLDLPTSHAAVQHVGTDLAVASDLTGTASLHFEVDSTTLSPPSLGGGSDVDLLVPVYRRRVGATANSGANTRPPVERPIVVEVDVFGNKRMTHSVSMLPASPWSTSLDPGSQQQLKEYYLIRLKSSEAAAFPLLTVLAPTRRGNAARRGWLSPVGTLLIDVPETPLILTVRLDVPEVLEVDSVGVRCGISTAIDYLTEIDEIRQKASDFATKRGNTQLSLRFWMRQYRACATKLGHELDHLTTKVAVSPSRNDRPIKDLRSRLSPAKRDVVAWLSRYGPNPFVPISRESVETAGTELRSIASKALKPVIVPGTLEGGEVKYQPLDMFGAVTGLVVPYSSRRSTREWLRPFLLVVLAGVQLAVAWRVRWPYKLWFDGEQDVGYLISRHMLRESAEPIVALLLIFPALLYGQFAQLRPETVAQQHSRLGTFAVLSLAFVLPLVPVMLVLGDSNPNSVAIWLSVSALGSLAAAALAILTSTGSYLSRVRRRRSRRRWHGWA
jgi:hypothetical protein